MQLLETLKRILLDTDVSTFKWTNDKEPASYQKLQLLQSLLL